MPEPDPFATKDVDLLSFVLDLSSLLVGLSIDSVDQGIKETLRKLSNHTQADRALLLKLEDDNLLSMTHEHCEKGISPVQKKYHTFSLQPFPLLQSAFQNNAVVSVPSLAALTSNELSMMQANCSKSAACVPISVNGRTWGGLILSTHHEREWTEDVLWTARVAGEMMGCSLVKKNSERLLRRTRELASQSMNSKELSPQIEELETDAELSKLLPDEGIAVYTTKKAMPDGRHLRLYACFACDYLSNKRSNARRHYQRCAKNTGSYACSQCMHGPFATIQAYCAHIKQCHQERKVQLTVRQPSGGDSPLGASVCTMVNDRDGDGDDDASYTAQRGSGRGTKKALRNADSFESIGSRRPKRKAAAAAVVALTEHIAAWNENDDGDDDDDDDDDSDSGCDDDDEDGGGRSSRYRPRQSHAHRSATVVTTTVEELSDAMDTTTQDTGGMLSGTGAGTITATTAQLPSSASGVASGRMGSINTAKRKLDAAPTPTPSPTLTGTGIGGNSLGSSGAGSGGVAKARGGRGTKRTAPGRGGGGGRKASLSGASDDAEMDPLSAPVGTGTGHVAQGKATQAKGSKARGQGKVTASGSADRSSAAEDAVEDDLMFSKADVRGVGVADGGSVGIGASGDDALVFAPLGLDSNVGVMEMEDFMSGLAGPSEAHIPLQEWDPSMWAKSAAFAQEPVNAVSTSNPGNGANVSRTNTQLQSQSQTPSHSKPQTQQSQAQSQASVLQGARRGPSNSSQPVQHQQHTHMNQNQISISQQYSPQLQQSQGQSHILPLHTPYQQQHHHASIQQSLLQSPTQSQVAGSFSGHDISRMNGFSTPPNSMDYSQGSASSQSISTSSSTARRRPSLPSTHNTLGMDSSNMVMADVVGYSTSQQAQTMTGPHAPQRAPYFTNTANSAQTQSTPQFSSSPTMSASSSSSPSRTMASSRPSHSPSNQSSSMPSPLPTMGQFTQPLSNTSFVSHVDAAHRHSAFLDSNGNGNVHQTHQTNPAPSQPLHASAAYAAASNLTSQILYRQHLGYLESAQRPDRTMNDEDSQRLRMTGASSSDTSAFSSPTPNVMINTRQDTYGMGGAGSVFASVDAQGYGKVSSGNANVTRVQTKFVNPEVGMGMAGMVDDDQHVMAQLFALTEMDEAFAQSGGP